MPTKKKGGGGGAREPASPPSTSDIKHLYVEVPEELHQQVKIRAVRFRRIKDYLVWTIEQFHAHAKPADAPFKIGKTRRLIIDLPEADANRFLELSKPFGSFREFVLRCLEASGVAIKGDADKPPKK